MSRTVEDIKVRLPKHDYNELRSREVTAWQEMQSSAEKVTKLPVVP